MNTGEQFKKEDIEFHETNHDFSVEKSFDYDQITEEIFLGTNMCCVVGYADELIKKGIVADISLEEERVDNPTGVDYFLWLPTEDGYAPNQKQISLGVEVIDFYVKNKIKVYVHCKNGHGRAPTLVAAYLVSRGMAVNEAMANIKLKRPSIHINNTQEKAIEDFSEALKVNEKI